MTSNYCKYSAITFCLCRSDFLIYHSPFDMFLTIAFNFLYDRHNSIPILHCFLSFTTFYSTFVFAMFLCMICCILFHLLHSIPLLHRILILFVAFYSIFALHIYILLDSIPFLHCIFLLLATFYSICCIIVFMKLLWGFVSQLPTPHPSTVIFRTLLLESTTCLRVFLRNSLGGSWDVEVFWNMLPFTFLWTTNEQT